MIPPYFVDYLFQVRLSKIKKICPGALPEQNNIKSGLASPLSVLVFYELTQKQQLAILNSKQ